MDRPEAWGICDRCGFRYFRKELHFQFDWRGNSLVNIRLLVCRPCTDVPNENFRPIIVGPDPVPIKDPRPGWYAQQMQGGPPIVQVAGGFLSDDVGGPITDDDGDGFLTP